MTRPLEKKITNPPPYSLKTVATTSISKSYPRQNRMSKKKTRRGNEED